MEVMKEDILKGTMIRKRRNQKKILTPKTEVGKKTELTIRYLYHENISEAE